MHIIAKNGYVLLLRDIWGVCGYKYALFLLLLTLTGFIEGLALASVVPLLSMVGVGQSAMTQQDSIGDIAIQFLAFLGLESTLSSLTLFVLFLLSLSAALYLLQAYVGARLQTAYVYAWQRRLASEIFGASWVCLKKYRNGDLVNALVSEAPRLGGGFYQTGLMLAGLVHGVIYLLIASLLSGFSTLLVLVGGALLFLLTRPLIGRAHITGKGLSDDGAELQSVVGEMILSSKSLKATSTEQDAIAMIEGVSDRLKIHSLRSSFDIQLAKGIFDFGAAAMVAGIIYFTNSVIYVEPAVTLVVLAIFVRLMPKLAGLQQSLQSISITIPTLVKLEKLSKKLAASSEMKNDKALPENMQSGALQVSLKGVSVNYAEAVIINNLTLDIRPGECIAFVGTSGAGKTTLVDILLGLAPISSGEVKLGGAAIDDLPMSSLRKRIGYMGQDPILYTATIKDNVLWGYPDARDDEFTKALEMSYAKSFVNSLPLGVDSPIGNGGSQLSGGEKQRIALARALIGDPGLLILDEATSALDAESEAAIGRALMQQKKRSTIILIAHRLASTKIADRICVLEKGSIVELGSWDELYNKQGGAFRRLWDMQMSS
jgi:ATP-binding cassette subfamily C protein